MDKRIRVLQLIHSFHVEGSAGGLGRFGIELARNINPKYYDVSICGLWSLYPHSEQVWINQLKSEGIEAFSATNWNDNKPYRSFSKATINILKWLRRNPVDIIHSHSEFSDVAIIMYKFINNHPILMRTVHYGHQNEWRKKPVRRLFLTNLLYPLILKAEVGVSKKTVHNLDNRWIAQLLKKQAIYISNAIDINRFGSLKINKAEIKYALKIPIEAPIVGSVGRLTEQKGYTYLINAAALLLKERPDVYFLIIGDGELAYTLNKQVHQLGIESHVIFTGPRSDVDKLLGCMDIFASSSLWEGLPTVLLEAMSSNVPVLATSIPGTNELIQHGVNGWLVPPHSVEELCAAITYLFNSPSLRLEMALRAKETVRKYSIDSIAQEYETLYQELISRI